MLINQQIASSNTHQEPKFRISPNIIGRYYFWGIRLLQIELVVTLELQNLQQNVPETSYFSTNYHVSADVN